jgi:hypothetical protein
MKRIYAGVVDFLVSCLIQMIPTTSSGCGKEND